VAVAQTGKVHVNSNGESIVGTLSRPVLSFLGCTTRSGDLAMLSRLLVEIAFIGCLVHRLAADLDVFPCCS